MFLLCGGRRRWWFCLHGVADGLELSDELAGASFGVVAADEVVHPKVVVGLISLEHVEDRHQDAVLDGDQGGVSQAGTQAGYWAAR